MRLLWTAAWVLAVAGPVLYLTDTASWWIGAVLVMPLMLLAVWRGGGETEIQGPFGAP